MEYMSSIQAFWTIIAFTMFIGIVVWAYSGERKQEFDEAAMLAFDKDDMNKSKQNSGDKDHV